MIRNTLVSKYMLQKYPGNYNIIQRLKGLPNPEPTTWPSKYKSDKNDLTIINNKKTYYYKNHIDYLYLTPNNTLYDNIFHKGEKREKI